MKLTHWISEYYLSSWGEVVKAALPPGIHRDSKLIIRYCGENEKGKESLSTIQKAILFQIQKKEEISFDRLKREFPRTDIRHTIGQLEKMRLVHMEHVFEKARVQVQREIWISLCDGIESEDIHDLRKRAPKQAKVLSYLIQAGGEARKRDLDGDFSMFRKLEKNGWIEIWEKEVFRESYTSIDYKLQQPIQLTEEQKKVVSQIGMVLGKVKFNVILLHGVTASGKTQVYIESIRQVLSHGKSALILIPEIGLTPQAVQRYRGVFGHEVAVLHSMMSPGERYDSWRKIREGKIKICLGTRSAVFAPLQNVGLIVVDEEHEDSYKQVDPAPRYHARDVAVVRGKINECVVLLGSATPSIESYTNALEGKYILCELRHRINHIPLPHITLVDRNHLLKEDQNRVFSSLLKEKIEERLSKNEQVILLQNRRGYATFLRCQACGAIEKCPFCNISLTYHQKNYRLRCHYCEFQKAAPDTCATCG
ncbi:primosomal protein N', partial [bacterium]|nr:primosomal protein N' [bacterium]